MESSSERIGVGVQFGGGCSVNRRIMRHSDWSEAPSRRCKIQPAQILQIFWIVKKEQQINKEKIYKLKNKGYWK